MSRHNSNSGLENTLGYFLEGIPVVFVEIEIALRSDQRLREYLEFYRWCEEKQIQNPPLTPRLCAGYERFITVLHEIRHFHDALLCKPLFEQFILRNQIAFCVAQLVSRVPLGVERIPINWDDHRIRMDRDATLLKGVIHSFDEQYFSLYGTLNDSFSFLGLEINLDYLIETNAIVNELVHLYKVHGARSTWDYYSNTISKLSDSKYTLLISRFQNLYGDLLSAISALYFAIPFCLYSSSNPTRTFCELVSRYESNPQSIYEACNPATLLSAFTEEGELERNIDSTILVGTDGTTESEVGKIRESGTLHGILDFHQMMYKCRKNLIDKYIGEFRYDPGLYFERLAELPIPPMLFFPEISGDKVKGVPEQEFHKQKIPMFEIAAVPENPENHIVLAGLMSLQGVNPAIQFHVADTQMLFAYFYKAAFEGKTAVYHPVIDAVYEKILREFRREPKSVL